MGRVVGKDQRKPEQSENWGRGARLHRWRSDSRRGTDIELEEAAQKAKTLQYQQRTDMPPKEYDRIQILTAYEIIEGAKIDCPPTMQVVKRFREAQTEMKV